MNSPMLNIAVRAARKAGQIIIKGYERPDEVKTSTKQLNDYVTNIDKAAEEAIIEIIQKSYPTHSIIAEEVGMVDGEDAEVQWIIDPLDGTRNFIKGLPHFSVSIAIRVKGRMEIGVVYDPIRNELFSAERGQGAKLNDAKLRINPKTELEGAILGTGFPFSIKKNVPIHLAMVGSLLEECADFRRSGSAALDLAYVAASRIDGFFEMNLKPWDVAAGELIVREAGGLVCDFIGGHDYLASGNLIAGSPRIVKDMLPRIKACLR